jgi:hypothetical protein
MPYGLRHLTVTTVSFGRDYSTRQGNAENMYK